MISLKKTLTKILEALATTTANGTLGTTSAVQSSDRHICILKKTGKQVRCYMGIGYNDATTTISSMTTLFTIPNGYRPKTRQEFPCVVYRASGTVIVANVLISTAGSIQQTSVSNGTMLYMTAEWETA